MERRSLNVDGLPREKIRERILNTWMQEAPGTGQYRYDVEKCRDGSMVYLLRPANLNKGCDFVIVSENYLTFQNGKDKPPKHNDVFDLILSAVGNNGEKGAAFYDAAHEVYGCTSPDEVLKKYAVLRDDPGCKFERALKLLRWMWIEQDITYWTGQGRGMLWEGFDSMMDRG